MSPRRTQALLRATLAVVALAGVVVGLLVGLLVGLREPRATTRQLAAREVTDDATVPEIGPAPVADPATPARTEAPVVRGDEPPPVGALALDPEAFWTGRVTGWREGAEVVVHLEWLPPEPVRSWPFVFNAIGTNWTRAERLASSPVDADGSFRIPALRTAPTDSKLRLRAEGPWLAGAEQVYRVEKDALQAWPSGPNPDDEPVVLAGVEAGILVLQLECPGGWTDAERADLAGRPVLIRRWQDDARSTLSPRTDDTFARAEANGTVQCRHMRPGAYYLVPTSDTSDPAECLAPFWVFDAEPMDVHAGQTTTARVELLRGVHVHGVARKTDGAPAANARVTLTGARSPLLNSYRSSVSTATDDEGRFVLWAAPTPLVRIEASLIEHRTATLEGRAMETALADPEGIEIRIDTGRTLRGRVVHEDGRAAGRVGIKIALPGDVARWGTLRTPSDEEGHFEVRALAAGRVELSVERAKIDGVEYGAWTSVEIADTDTEPTCTLVLRAPTTIRGRVVDPDGEPLDAVRIHAGPLERLGNPAAFARRTSTLGAKAHAVEPTGPGEGTFELEGVGQKPLGIWAQIGQRGGVRSSPLLVVEDPTNAGDLELVLLRANSIRGFVVDEDGAPVADARVELRLAGRFSDDSRGRTKTGEEGTFAFSGLEDGDYRMTARTRSLVTREPLEVALRQQRSDPAEARITVETGGRVVVSVPLASSSGRRIASPFLRSADGARVGVRARPTRGVANEWTMTPVLAGEYTIAVPVGSAEEQRLSASNAPAILVRPIVVAPGETTRVTFDGEQELSARLSGTVRSREGEALRDYRVQVRSADLVLAQTSTDWEGRFEISFAPSEGAVVELRTGYPPQVVRRVELPRDGAGAHELDWVLPTGEVQGTLDVPHRQHQANGTMIDLVPEGADATRHVLERSVGWTLSNGFRFEHVSPGRYTLTGWRRGPDDGLHGRSRVATRPLKIEVGASGAVENLVLELLPDARATVERR
ncbi:MAG: carboxypeptidase-like regulatory domain-containing protein [Planctomycetota bacterium]